MAPILVIRHHAHVHQALLGEVFQVGAVFLGVEVHSVEEGLADAGKL